MPNRPNLKSSNNECELVNGLLTNFKRRLATVKKKLIFDKLMVEFIEQKNVYNLEMNSDMAD